jgi:alanine dehydrogenase
MKEFSSASKIITLQKEGYLTQEEKLETGKKSRRLLIGVPRETLSDEGRVAITPLAVELLTQNGHQVLIETNAGKVCNFQDLHYSECGAVIVSNNQEIYNCDIVIKVAPFNLEEIALLKGNQIIISSLHISAQSTEYIRRLMEKKVTAIAFEYLKDESDTYPIVRTMSEIAGTASILIASEYLSNQHNGKGEMLGGITGITPSEVVIIGAGTAGEFAAKTARGLGALVKVFDPSIYKLKRLQNDLGARVFTSMLHPKVLANALKSADVVIGALRLIDKGPRYIVSEEMVKSMKNGSVIIDISIDQGGCFETSQITSHSNPVFRKHGVVHYCVPNIPSRVARTASYALSNVFAPLLINIGQSDNLKVVLKENPGIRNGVFIYQGILTNNYIGNLFNISSKDIDLLMAAF